MVYFARATLRFDGACQPNPGEGGCGYVIFNDNNGKTIVEGRYYVGAKCTNNVAEYFGLIKGLKRLRSSSHTIGHLEIQGDSELIIKHLRGNYYVRSPRLKPLFRQAKSLLDSLEGREFDSVSFTHISRSANEKADELAKDAVDYGEDWSMDHY